MTMRKCLPIANWPETDRRLWIAATAPNRVNRFTDWRAADHLAPATLRKALGGYQRWLGWLLAEGLLDTTVAPAARVTPPRVAAWLDALRASGNRDYTVVGRLAELSLAMRMMAPDQDFGWLTRPGAIPVRARLPMRRRTLSIHHPKRLYDWGMRMIAEAPGVAGPARRRVMMRDGVMIAILAARAPRLRTLSGLRLGVNLRRDKERWTLDLGECDIKTRKPISYPLPRTLSEGMDRYVAVERVELLAGGTDDALWIDWSGKAMRPRGIEKRIRWWSTKEFGPAECFGPHRFRHAIGTCGPIDDPEAPGVSTAILGVTAQVHRAHYDRGARAAAAKRFESNLGKARRDTASLARQIFARRAGEGPASPDPYEAHLPGAEDRI